MRELAAHALAEQGFLRDEVTSEKHRLTIHTAKVEDRVARMKAQHESSSGQWKAKWQACMFENKYYLMI